jgi:nitrate/nitrite transporter NarK
VVASGTMVLLLLPQSNASALLTSFLMGFTGRGQGALFNVLQARYYGRNSYGAITGFITPFQMTALGLGPLLGSAIHDTFGNYQTAFTLYIAFYWVAIVLIFLARAPRHPSTPRIAAA